MDPLAGMDDSSTEDDTASETTEDDPQIPENQAPPAPSLPAAPSQPPTVAGVLREKPHYALRHTMRGHTMSISAVKFSPDGKLLASCGMSIRQLIMVFAKQCLNMFTHRRRKSCQNMVSRNRRVSAEPHRPHTRPLRHFLV